MIVFDLLCDQSHRFEVWFRSSSDYADQLDRHLIACPKCGSTSVRKALTAPRLTAKSNQQADRKPTADRLETATGQKQAIPSGAPVVPPMPSQQPSPDLKEALAKLRQIAHATCDNVGDQFAEEARKIHYGEAEQRGIMGTSSLEEVRDLHDEGIAVLPVPQAPEDAN